MLSSIHHQPLNANGGVGSSSSSSSGGGSSSNGITHKGQSSTPTVVISRNFKLNNTATGRQQHYNHERNYSYIEAIKDGEDTRSVPIATIQQQLTQQQLNYIKSSSMCNSTLSGYSCTLSNVNANSNNSKTNSLKCNMMKTSPTIPSASQSPDTSSINLSKSQSQSSILNLFKQHFTSPFSIKKFRSKSKENHHSNHVVPSTTKPVKATTTQKTLIRTQLNSKSQLPPQPPHIKPSKSDKNNNTNVNGLKTSLTIKLSDEQLPIVLIPQPAPLPAPPASVSPKSTTSSTNTQTSSCLTVGNNSKSNDSGGSSLSYTSKTPTTNTASSSPKQLQSPRLQSNLHLTCLLNGYDNFTTKCLLQTKQKLNELRINDDLSYGTANGRVSGGDNVKTKNRKQCSNSKSVDSQRVIVNEPLVVEASQQTTSMPIIDEQVSISVNEQMNKGVVDELVVIDDLVVTLEPVCVNEQESCPSEPVVINEQLSAEPEAVVVSPSEPVVDEQSSNVVIKDGNYYIDLLDKEIVELLKLCDKYEITIDTNENENLKNNEEVMGKIQSAIGKTRLLVRKKCEQFRGLCKKNLQEKIDVQIKILEFRTLDDDLAGFWDMLCIQMVDVRRLFKELDELRENNWIIEEKKIVKKFKNLSNTKPKVTATIAPAPNKNRIDESRKRLLEAKRAALKQQQQQIQSQELEQFEQENSLLSTDDVNIVIFENDKK